MTVINLIQRLISAISGRPNAARALFAGASALIGSLFTFFFTRKVDSKKYQKEIVKLQKVIASNNAEIEELEKGNRAAKKLAKQNKKLVKRIAELEKRMQDDSAG